MSYRRYKKKADRFLFKSRGYNVPQVELTNKVEPDIETYCLTAFRRVYERYRWLVIKILADTFLAIAAGSLAGLAAWFFIMALRRLSI